MKKTFFCMLGLLLLASAAFAAGPTVNAYSIDGRVPVGDDPINAKPLLEVQLTGANVSLNAFLFKIDSVTQNPGAYRWDGQYFQYQVTTELEEGWHFFLLEAADDTGPMTPAFSFQGFVASLEQEVLEDPLAIPNPATKNMRITYKMAKSGDVNINIYDLNGELVWQRELLAGEPGAQAGYNEVIWDLRSGYYEDCPNGPYLCVIMREDRELEKYVSMAKIKLFILR